MNGKKEERVTNNKWGIFGLHTPPRIEEETTGNQTIKRNFVFDYRETPHDPPIRYDVSHFLERAQHTPTMFSN
jgi:hypothetical protein